MPRKRDKLAITDETMELLQESVDDLHEMAYEFGLTPPHVQYWLVDHDEINQLAAYNGFQTRYPHWRWGMKYVERKKKDTFFGGKIFELVNNDDPPRAFLQESNDISDQKSVIAHVEAHADFFKNNQFFDPIEASQMLEQHANIIESYYEDPSIDREDVESWIDAIHCIEDHIDPLTPMEDVDTEITKDNKPGLQDKIDSLDIADEVKRQVFDDVESEDETQTDVEPNSDVLAFLMKHGKQYNEELEKSLPYEDWQITILEILRREAYYFSPQFITKIMNEGWAAFWESMMMTREGYATDDEFIRYADRQSQVLTSPGLNPYKLGKELWEYIENQANRREVIDKLLRIEGINWRNYHEKINFNDVRLYLSEYIDETEPHGRHYSLLRERNRGFIEKVTKDELKKESRYTIEDEVYESIDGAIADVDFEAGWKKMREVRETHNDITFIDSYLTSEFIQQQQYFAYEFSEKDQEYQVSGTDLDSVKKKLLLQTANKGKPTIIAADNNYQNAGELLLKHMYNGIPLDITEAKKVLERVFTLWGRPVNLKTIIIDEDDGEIGKVYRYDGEKHHERDVSNFDDIKADEIDYDTKPAEWTQ